MGDPPNYGAVARFDETNPEVVGFIDSAAFSVGTGREAGPTDLSVAGGFEGIGVSG